MVERQMEGYQERMAKRIQREAAKHGETALELAQELGVYPTTVERWFRGERVPQRRHRKELAKHWDLPLDAFEFDLEAEEREVRDQLNRIEGMLRRLLEAAGLPTEQDEDGEDEGEEGRLPADLIPPGDQPGSEDAVGQS